MVDVAHSGNNRDNEDEGDDPTDRNHRDGRADRPAEPDASPDTGSDTGTDTDSGEPDGDSDAESGATAGTEAKRRKPKRPRSFLRELPILVGVALLLALLIQTFVARVFVIPSESMEETLHGCPGCYGDRVLVDKLVYGFGDPEPGEVVVFKRPGTWNQSEFQSNRSSNAFVSWLQDVGAAFGLASPDEDDVVKRVVAVGGQRVECCDDRNHVLVDGRPLEEPYVYWTPSTEPRQATFSPITVPEGMLFVLGDNRNNSSDSRYQGGGGRNGLVPVDNVIGKVRWVVLPPARWQGVGDDNPQAATVAAYGIPLGGGLLAAWPVLWLGRRVRTTVRKAVRGAGDEP